jgi:dsRNA-specific ribonuclease
MASNEILDLTTIKWKKLELCGDVVTDYKVTEHLRENRTNRSEGSLRMFIACALKSEKSKIVMRINALVNNGIV